MTKVSDKISIAALSVSLLFLMSAVSVPVAFASTNPRATAPAATPLTALQANWASPDGNPFNQNYNPQTQINSTNVQYLGLNWLFPIPPHPAPLLSIAAGVSVDTAPLIINGTVYAVTEYGEVFALNAANGAEIWADVLPITTNSTFGLGVGSFTLHLHDGDEQFTTKLFGGTPTFWVSAPDYKIYAINAVNGHYEMNFSYYFGIKSIPGNNPNTVYNHYPSMVVIDENRGIAIISMISSSSNNAARCYYRGYNILVNPPQPLWTAYCSPPEPGSTLSVNPNWDIQQVNNMTGAEIFYPGPAFNAGGYIPGTAVVNLKTLTPSVMNATLYNDWGYANQSPTCSASDGGGSPGGTGGGWGAPWVIDEKTGIAYVNTGNKGPYTSPCTPGPDLWSASVMALNDQTGQWIWGFQTSAHEDWDYDCSWQQVLGNETINGVNTEVLWKTCKNGYLYELNAANGNLIWAWTPPTSIMARCAYCFMHNPLNQTEMTEGFFNPSYADTLMFPSSSAGFENEFSFNPAANTLFLASQNVPALIHYITLNSTNYGGNNGFSSIAIAATASNLDNSTVEAVNAATGQMLWSHYIPSEGYRGGLTTSGNVVYLTLSSGDVQMLNAQTGTLIKDLYIGGPLNVLASIGADAAGQMEVIFPIVAGHVSWGTSVPGDIVALTLQNVPSSSGGTTITNTVTGSTITTVTTVGGGGATVTSTSTTIQTTTVAGKGSTVTVSGTATTITSTATSSTGVTSTTLYGVAAVAVIFIIATGYLAMRGRKPAS
ncbi:MAG TPA: hypothetical protein VLX56_02535 [Nitrososphaerales archaeon]|nr:hypothetical protein [Nitrososphaerales archaeon]